MKKRLFHGTSFHDTMLILKNGFRNSDRVWEVSHEDNIYFYDMDKMKEVEYLDSKREASNECIRKALLSAQITASVKKHLHPIICVLEVEIDDEHVKPDDSCDEHCRYSMFDSGAVQVDIDDLREYGTIKRVYVSNDYFPSLAGLYISSVLDNAVDLNLSGWEEVELNFLKGIDLEIYDRLLEVDWRNFNVKDFLQKFKQ